MNKLFPVMDVGSLRKLPGRQAKLKGGQPSALDLENISKVVAAAGSDKLRGLADAFLDAQTTQDIIAANSRFNIALMEGLGLDYVFNGEAHRPEMYKHVVERVNGLVPLEVVVSFTNEEGFPNVSTQYMYESPLSLRRPLHTAETKHIVDYATNRVKTPVTGAYTLATWTNLGTLPELYMQDMGYKRSEAARTSIEDLAFEFADNVINPTLKEVAGLGVARIQIDEPSASSFDGQLDILLEATRRSIAGVDGVELGMHICYSRDYALVAELAQIPELRFLALELANRDSLDHRNYTQTIQAFEAAGFTGQYCVGVVNIHTDKMETPELVAQRLIHVAEIPGPNGIIGPERVEAGPDCGLRSRPLPVAVQKLAVTVQGAELARQHYS